ncbi:hypothetical protein Fcan01_05724 [Folsomia candida]|uniref:DUF4789 domain-containing protein n=1 Tax=Folsomia candida TaxID=158441 RepID=A0A226ERR6_FOLCA|nr:hypothetical protein Fcan01_05724 [Folsomia candida]
MSLPLLPLFAVFVTLILFRSCCPSPQINLIVELRTRHLAIPVPYRPEQSYKLGAPTMQRRHKPKVTTNLTIDHYSTEPSLDDQILDNNMTQHGRSMGRSMGKPSRRRNQGMANSTNNNGTDGIYAEDYGPNAKMLAQMSVGGKYVREPADTNAQHGAKALEWDYCEKAKYPNKGRMVCATADLDEKLAGTCICKYAKISTNTWVQMNYNQSLNICRSPNGGACYVKFPNGKFTVDNEPLYQKNITLAHDQCDDNQPWNSTSRQLLCSKPHPRRFSAYNAYHYYCLKKPDRLPEVKHNAGA